MAIHNFSSFKIAARKAIWTDITSHRHHLQSPWIKDKYIEISRKELDVYFTNSQ